MDKLNCQGTREELQHWLENARCLMRDGDQVASVLSREDNPEKIDAIMAAYRARHPGFSSETYHEAMARGTFWAIW
ncbi:hypothetical protein E2493_20900 [Sphingomonas parva]|uniref:Uncharacterized protein n=1 Tax=Sphingomonas parva TaxID=2555898 RepID=A0A4Y8ZNC3_9SPHN|nr:hypothetical protein [Sphingomonas parva]TFI56299.1 hypothetical protein E2493_20900 [Sphingomonas parva]